MRLSLLIVLFAVLGQGLFGKSADRFYELRFAQAQRGTQISVDFYLEDRKYAARGYEAGPLEAATVKIPVPLDTVKAIVSVGLPARMRCSVSVRGGSDSRG